MQLTACVMQPWMAGLGCAALLLSSCNQPVGLANRTEPALVRLAEDEAKGLDPQTISDLASLRIATDQYEGLMRLGANGAAEPGLASGYVVSADRLTWRFSLRPGIRFADGHPIEAALFVAVFNRLNDEATASPTASLFESIARVEAADTRTVLIRLNHPFPALPELVAHPAIAALPLHNPKWVEARPSIASGAYRLMDWQLGDQIVLQANPNWHGGAPATRQVIWRPVTDGLTALREFQSGAADIVGEIPSARLETAKANLGQSVRIADYRGSYYFAFNTRKPPFNDVRVRRALHLATERDWIAKSLMRTGVQPAWGIIPPGTSGLSPLRPDWADQSRAQRLKSAAKLLAEAGYGPDKPLDFEVRFNSDADHRRVSVALAAMWQPLGVRARMLNSESSLHFASLRRHDFALARSGWIGDLSVPENFLAVHKGDGGPVNYSGYASLAFDDALKAALAEPDATKRAAAMRKAETVLAQDVPILPLYFYVSKSLVAPRVTGWVSNAANVHPSRTLGIGGGG